MLIENDNHFHTLYVVVRLSALYKKTWILGCIIETHHFIHQRVTYVHLFGNPYLCGKPVEKPQNSVENLWKTCGDCGCNIYHTHM